MSRIAFIFTLGALPALRVINPLQGGCQWCPSSLVTVVLAWLKTPPHCTTAGSSLAEGTRDRQMAPVALGFVNQLVTGGSHPILPFPLLALRNMGIKPSRQLTHLQLPPSLEYLTKRRVVLLRFYLLLQVQDEPLLQDIFGGELLPDCCHGLWDLKRLSYCCWDLWSLLTAASVTPYSSDVLGSRLGEKRTRLSKKKKCFAVPSGFLRMVCSA